jgi:putative nucleotidyltransferase with HDIG domain
MFKKETALLASAGTGMPFKEYLARVNQELWLVLSLFVVAGLLNWLMDAGRMVLGLYTLPTIFSAYVYGRRHAVLTACASVVLVLTLSMANGDRFLAGRSVGNYERWADIGVWAGLLLVTAYAMGTLYERQQTHFMELRRTYFGLLSILQQFISNDKYTHNHSNRVAHYAGNIAARMGLPEEHVDDIRAAALLHDIGKLDTSRDLLYKAASLTSEEMVEMRQHVKKGAALLSPVGGTLSRVIPIILAHHERYDGSGYEAVQGADIPLGARVIGVADAYDTLTSDRPYRRAVTPYEAKEIIARSAGKNFDPAVVTAFVSAFDRGEMEIPEALAV